MFGRVGSIDLKNIYKNFISSKNSYLGVILSTIIQRCKLDQEIEQNTSTFMHSLSGAFIQIRTDLYHLNSNGIFR